MKSVHSLNSVLAASAKSNNVTSTSHQDERTRLEDVLKSNQTLDVITEDNGECKHVCFAAGKISTVL